MKQQIHIGDRATTVGPLKPAGQVEVGGETIEASSQGAWIDGDAQVVIVGGDTRRVVVRVPTPDEKHERGGPLQKPVVMEETPLQSPPGWVERINSLMIGFVLGILLIGAAWLKGITLSPAALILPISGMVSGWLFRAFLGTAIQTVGPREDHRPRATAIALFLLLGEVVGVAIGLNAGAGFIAISIGLIGGVLIAGALCFVAIFFAHV